jgi:hypothetical protein
MTGLNLEAFLHLLRADLGAWMSLAVVVLVLALMTWTSWGSQRALRKCLVLSVVVHMGLVLYGSTLPTFFVAGEKTVETEEAKDSIREIRVAPWVEKSEEGSVASADGRTPKRVALWDRPRDSLAWTEPFLRPDRTEPQSPEIVRPKDDEGPALANPEVAPEVNPPEPPRPERRSQLPVGTDPLLNPLRVAPGDPAELPKVVMTDPLESDVPAVLQTPIDRQLRPDHLRATEPSTEVTPSRTEPIELPQAPMLEPPPTTTVLEARPGSPARSPTDLSPAASIDPDPEPIVVDRSNSAARSTLDVPLVIPGDSDLRRRIRRPAAAKVNSATTTAASPTNQPRSAGVNSLDPTTSASSGDRGTLKSSPTSASELFLPDTDVRNRTRTNRQPTGPSGLIGGAPARSAEAPLPFALAHVTPRGPSSLATNRAPLGARSLADVPAVYRSRLDPNRSALAQRAGASPASEQAVERSLDWLVRHQDADGRWNGGSSDTLIPGLEAESRESFTIHCPPGEICFGECSYAEADAALTGLALLAYLGAGYTHMEGKYSEPVRKGLRYLLLLQKADGDLRGRSEQVGLYCHSMAALAICEAYAMTGDERLRQPVERAVDFLLKAQATDGLAWRYRPRDRIGDTSILGWVVLVLRSAKVVGLSVPAKIESGAVTWLHEVSAGQAGGLAKYQPFPSKPVTPTMTAEAWVCRQLLNIGGPGPASTEAGEYLLTHGPDRDPYNLYYWYYGTLAMYQHGGVAWSRWNGQVRDQLVSRQRTTGHAVGSWDPDDDDQYGVRGGRIYSTALATLTLEVYYRYLRFYDEPGPAQILAPRPDRTSDPTLRRAVSPKPSSRR